MARILVIDDDAVSRTLLQRVLEGAGHAVTTVRSGKEGMAQFQVAPHDLVITDVIMPGMSGADVIAALRKANPNVKVIGISGGVPDFPQVRRLPGANRMLTKPIDRDAVLKAVQDVMEGWEGVS